MTFPIKALGLTTICLGGPSTIGIGYMASKETFSKYLEDICLPVEINENGDWKLAQDKLTATSASIFSKEFQDLKKKLDAIKDTDNSKRESGELLKDLCTGIYNWTYKSWFFQKEDLFQDIEKFCSLNIEDKLDKEKKFDVEGAQNQEQLKEKVNELRKPESSNNESLDPRLTALKSSSTSDQDWETLRNWCRDTYKEAYLGTRTSNKLKLAQKYCQKN